MGYYTKFTIEVTGAAPDLDLQDIADSLDEISEYNFEVEEGTIQSSDTYKWYEHSEHMKVLAKKYTSLMFTLKGEGEEAGDIWRQFFKGDKFSEKQHPTFVFPEPPEWVGK